MNLMTTKEASRRFNISPRRVALLCEQGRILGAVKIGNCWVMSDTTEKPIDKRIKSGEFIKQAGEIINYELRQYDRKLLKFSLTREFDGLQVKILWEDKECKNLLPLDLVVSEEGLLYWLKGRIIPRNRAYVENFLASQGINERDIKGIIDICYGLSLTDCYWTPKEHFPGCWAKYNLFENRFSNILALMAFIGYGSRGKNALRSSPEFTTNGMLAKCWRRIDGKIQLYKTGTVGAANTGREPYSEYYANQIAYIMKLNAVEYNLSMWKGQLCSTCVLFTDINMSFISIGRLLPEARGIREVLAWAKATSIECYDTLIDMLVFDAIICNTDRHFGNFGVLVNNTNNQIKGIAPIFDNGLSLFCYAMDDSMEKLDIYAKTRTPATYPDFITFTKEIITKRQRDKLRLLLTFTFKKHPRYNLADKRLKQIEKFIHRRINELIGQ